MKNFKLIIVFVCALLLVGCADQSDDTGIKAFQGQSAEQIFNGGQKAMNKKKYDEAINHFEALNTLYPFGAYSQQGQLDIIYAYYQNGDYDSAVAAADRYIHLYPRDKNVDYAYYMKGKSYFDKNVSWLSKHVYPIDPAQRDLTTFKQAFTVFDELVGYFPDSKYAPDARRRMIFIRNVLARHELQVAQFYMEHKAYVAAANRATNVVSHYQGTPYVPDALKIMIKAYTALGATKQAEDAARVLKLNYPKK